MHAAACLLPQITPSHLCPAVVAPGRAACACTRCPTWHKSRVNIIKDILEISRKPMSSAWLETSQQLPRTTHNPERIQRNICRQESWGRKGCAFRLMDLSSSSPSRGPYIASWTWTKFYLYRLWKFESIGCYAAAILYTACSTHMKSKHVFTFFCLRKSKHVFTIRYNHISRSS